MAEQNKENLKLPLLIADIHELLPHRYPMLLVDRVIELADGDKIVGIKNVSANEPFFEGHFPGQPIMPGVLMLEALAQLGVIYAKVCSNSVDKNKLYVFAATDEVRFRRPVVPGDVLRMEMSVIARRASMWKMKGIVTVDGDVAAEGILTAAVYNAPKAA